MARNALKRLWFITVVSLVGIAAPRPCFAHGAGGGGVGGGGIGGGPGSAGGGIGGVAGVGGIGVSVGPVGASPGVGGIGGVGAAPGGAPGAISGAVGPAPGIGIGIGSGAASGASGGSVAGAIGGAPGVGAISGAIGAGAPGVGATGISGASPSNRGQSLLHAALYGRPGNQPSYNDVMQAGIRANSSAEKALSTMPLLPAIPPPVEKAPAEVKAPQIETQPSQYAAVEARPPAGAQPSLRVPHHARRIRRHPQLPGGILRGPIQTSIVPAAN